MKVAVINPNTTAAMTVKIAAAARAVAAPGTQIVASNPADGPASIEGYFDEAFSVPGLLAEIIRHSQQTEPPDAYVLACFDDTGLDAARCISAAPVIGIGEAAFHCASLVAHRFGVVTTLARSVAAIEHNLVKYGLASRCSGVRASEVAVLALDDPQSNARQKIDAEIARALQDDGAQALVLGCAGMADLVAQLSQHHGVPVVDGVAAAVTLAEGLVRLGLRTSQRGPYAPPLPKVYSGRFEAFSPR